MSNRKKKNDTEAVVAEAMREVNKAMKEVAQATAPLRRMSSKNDIEQDSMPYNEPVPASSQPTIQSKGAAIQIKKPGGLFGSSNTVINIQSAQNIQIGDNNTMIINSTGNRRRNLRNISPPPLPKSIEVDKAKVQQILGSKRVIEEKELMMVSTKFMGREWRRILRLIGLDDVELDRNYQDYNAQGIKEITFQCLLLWKRKQADDATVGVVASALCELYSKDEVCAQFSP